MVSGICLQNNLGINLDGGNTSSQSNRYSAWSTTIIVWQHSCGYGIIRIFILHMLINMYVGVVVLLLVVKCNAVLPYGNAIFSTLQKHVEIVRILMVFIA